MQKATAVAEGTKGPDVPTALEPAAPDLESELPLVRRPSFIQAQARWEQWALNHAARAQLQSYCVMCNIWLASSKHVKQHLNRTHAMHLGDIPARANTLCLTFKSQLTRGRACLFCHSKVGAPARHSQQCTVLFQLTVAHLYVQDALAPRGRDDGEHPGQPGSGHLPLLFSERPAGSPGSCSSAQQSGATSRIGA